jgi:hypothetical protein
MSGQRAVDINGNIVKVGDFVRILAIEESVLADIDPKSQARVLSMINQNLAVYEVDQYDRAWVEQWWHEDSSNSTSHSLALDSQHIELCT